MIVPPDEGYGNRGYGEMPVSSFPWKLSFGLLKTLIYLVMLFLFVFQAGETFELNIELLEIKKEPTTKT